MGKKKVLKQSEEEMIKETGVVEAAVKKNAVSTAKRLVKAGQAFVQATYNNTIITITDDHGNTLAATSAGALGFKGAKKSTPFAAMKVVEAVLERVKKSGIASIDVYVKGIGSGRESAVRALATHMNVTSIADVTPVPHNGCRPPKVRRV